MKSNFSNVCILSVAHTEAPKVLSSFQIEKQFESTYKRLGMEIGFIEKMTGIKERRYWEAGTPIDEIATLAAQKCIQQSGIDAHKIGLLINTSVCRDYLEPSVACLIHGNLKLSSDCVNFDITNACLGFVDGMNTAGMMIESRQIDYAIIVNAENPIFGIDSTIKRIAEEDCTEAYFNNNFATLTLGCGAAAVLLCHKDVAPKESPSFLGGVFQTATEFNRLCMAKPEKMLTDTRELLRTGVELGIKAAQLADWKNEDFDLFIPHQVSNSYISKISEALGIDFKKQYLIYPTYGNIGPASVAYALSKAVADDVVKPGYLIGILGFGSGINCGLMKIRW
jgi:acyl-CoA:acyl-CoA alkyltransferase